MNGHGPNRESGHPSVPWNGGDTSLRAASGSQPLHFPGNHLPQGIVLPPPGIPPPHTAIPVPPGFSIAHHANTLPPTEESVSRMLDYYVEHRNHEVVQRRMESSENEAAAASNVRPWVRDMEADLRNQQENSQGETGLSSLTQHLCKNRDSLRISAPFELSTDTFHNVESAVVAYEEADGGSEQDPFCLSCLKPPDNTTMEFSQDTQAAYTPAGYEDLHLESEATASEPSIYLFEVKDIRSENGQATRGVGTNTKLEDFAIITPSKTESPTPLSVRFISSSRFIEILRSHAHSYQASRSAVLAEAPLPLPVAVGVGLVAVVTNDPNALQYPSIDLLTESGSNGGSGSQTGVLVLKFGQGRLQLRSEPPDPFSSAMTYKQFFIGTRYCFFDARKHTESQLENQNSSKEVLRTAHLNAERFVPLQKRRQWDELPHALLSVMLHAHLAGELSPLLTRPDRRRSCYDMAVANAILYLSPMISSNTFIITNFMGFGFGVAVGNIQKMLQRNKTKVVSESLGMLTSSASGIAPNFYRLKQMCMKVDAEPTNAAATKIQRSSEMGDILVEYVRRTLFALEMERLRCLEDMKQHDLYSVRWKHVEIPPPNSPHPGCRGCGTQNGNFLCAYHSACQQTQQKGGSVVIRNKEQLERFPGWLSLLRPDDRIVARITVPGVADNFPLVSVGDMVRFRFSGHGISTEVIGEVADVIVKTEIVSLCIPPPFHGGVQMEVLPYLQALLRSENLFVSALSIIQSNMRFPLNPRYSIHEITGPESELIGRFDMRFGFLGGQGFEISRQVLHSAVPLQAQNLNTDKKLTQLCRILAPTHLDVEDRASNSHQPISDWVHPVNVAQTTAVFDIVNSSHGLAPYLIFGPAGTGKSLTVCEAVIQVLRRNPVAKILVCAPSDSACDVLATRLLPLLRDDEGIKNPLLRINWWFRKTSSLPPSLLPCTPMSQNGTFLIPSKEQIIAASVVVCQCFVAGCLEQDDLSQWMSDHFTHVFVDECSQAMECEALIPLLKVGSSCSLILAGDPRQLGPTVRDKVSAKLGLGVSVQDRLMQLPLYKSDNYHVMTTLVGNYRSHNALLTVPSNLFYNGSLQCLAKDEVSSPYANWGGLGPARFPLLLCDVWKGKEQSKLDTPSFFNLEECDAAVLIVRGLLSSEKIGKNGGIDTREICVITPFRAQVLTLRTKLRLAGLGSINVGVVEDFQGQEFSIVLISTVLTQEHQRWSRNADEKNGAPGAKLGFMHDPKRFNVAITRAHAICIVVGHAKYLKSTGTYWSALIEHIERNDGIIGADGEAEISVEEYDHDELSESTDPYGISKLLQRVEELKLGSGHEENRLDLSYYYEDVPQWKVMLT